MGTVQDLGQVAKTALLVQHFVGLGELVTVLATGTGRLEPIAETFDQVKEPLAGPLSFLGVEVVFLVGSLFQMVRGHHRVLKKHEFGTAPELFDLGQGPGWSSGGSDRDDSWELELIFFGGVLSVFLDVSSDFTK